MTERFPGVKQPDKNKSTGVNGHVFVDGEYFTPRRAVAYYYRTGQMPWEQRRFVLDYLEQKANNN